MDARVIVELYIPITLGVIMLAMGLGLRTIDFVRVVVDPRAILVGVLGQLVMLPALGFALAHAFGLPPALAVGLIVLTACPGGPSSNLYTYLARGDVALSVSLTAINGFVTILTIPFVVNLGLDTFMGEARDVHMPVGETILTLILIVGLPLLVGMYLRARHPRKADPLERILKRVAIIMLAILIVGAIAKERVRIGEYLELLGVPIVTLSLAGITLGLLLSVLVRLRMRQAATISIEVGMQNAALAMGIAMTGLGSEEIAMPAVIYGILAYFTCGLVVLMGRRFIPAGPPPAVATPPAAAG